MSIQQIYGALLPAKNLPEPLHTVQGDLVDQIILNPHFEICPPSVTYQRAFWKYVTQTIEAAGEVGLKVGFICPVKSDLKNIQEVDDRIYQRYISLLKARCRFLLSPVESSCTLIRVTHCIFGGVV
jgi:hypothetical protein